MSATHTEDLARRLGQLLAARGQWVTAAESCTGGRIAGAITDIAGSSGWFGYGFVSYGNEAKQKLLGVSAETLAEHGAVSSATVREMADGALRESGADWAVAVSGVAGPGGGSTEKPVGLVWFGLAGQGVETRAFSERFAGDRAAVRAATVDAALSALIAAIEAQG
ncbi:CinA family protein [Crenobacter cavernae]|uniref:Nicotinamide-nucleotide amidohydrolase family protein n=1 Tax=Crenobacter cavernae TaxID=2290923 RepID=A0ABY0FDD7_9NEIS|nr:nicotinamide-nucleotide amidohydrolase family protein [Crenobacter cavernae]RXZ42628.1 nicotinamide-nucleotide amidohydrolase family protein [Crenobacter cavernae]